MGFFCKREPQGFVAAWLCRVTRGCPNWQTCRSKPKMFGRSHVNRCSSSRNWAMGSLGKCGWVGLVTGHKNWKAEPERKEEENPQLSKKSQVEFILLKRIPYLKRDPLFKRIHDYFKKKTPRWNNTQVEIPKASRATVLCI